MLLYASKYQDVPTVINVSGRYDLKRGMEDRLGEDFLQRIKKDGFLDVTTKNGILIYGPYPFLEFHFNFGTF